MKFVQGVCPGVCQGVCPASPSSVPRSPQVLSPLLTFVVEIKTRMRMVTLPLRIWVVKNMLGGRIAGYFDCCCGKLGNFQNLEQWLKTTRSIGVRSRILLMKNATLFLPSPKYRRLSFSQKQIQQPNGAQNFRGLKCHVPNRRETSGSVSVQNFCVQR